jgi:acetylornithine deacetylase/succinyl-diaminopimelate desuccinylase-like protein
MSHNIIGIVPDSFRIMRQLLDRIEDSKTGRVLLKESECDIPEVYVEYARETAATMGAKVLELPFADGVQPVDTDSTQLLLNSTWRATLCYTGISGVPLPAAASNTLRKETEVKLSVRLPPYCDPTKCNAEMKRVLEANPPYGARVIYDAKNGNYGWAAPKLPDWLETAVSTASTTYYGKPYRAIGEGGSIPFMAMLGKKFPKTSFVITGTHNTVLCYLPCCSHVLLAAVCTLTGVLGPGSNAHGPNEFLEMNYTKKIICCVAHILAAHAQPHAD